MPRIKNPDDCKTAQHVNTWCLKNGWVRSEGGSHTKYRSPGGNRMAVVPRHKGDLRTGTMRSIIKILLGVGLICAIVVIFV